MTSPRLNDSLTAPQETRGARSTRGARTRPRLENVSAVLDAAKAALRGKRSARAATAERLTAYEDWLEYEHPSHRLRAALRVTRRQLEASS